MRGRGRWRWWSSPSRPIPFLIADRTGVLGEGIYTNDHAAQLYWADWLQRGFGPEPSAVKFGYPTGPQSVAVLAAQATGASLVSAFNGLLLAIPALTALTALGGLRRLAAPSRLATAIIVGIPYLGASFLAQSAFKETAMALFVLAFALLMATRSGEADDAPPPSWRLLVRGGRAAGARCGLHLQRARPGVVRDRAGALARGSKSSSARVRSTGPRFVAGSASTACRSRSASCC